MIWLDLEEREQQRPSAWFVTPPHEAFYEKQQFPSSTWHGAFVAEHGSWNRRIRSGYQVVFIPFRNGLPSEEPQSFFSGFVPDAAGSSTGAWLALQWLTTVLF